MSAPAAMEGVQSQAAQIIDGNQLAKYVSFSTTLSFFSHALASAEL